MVSPVAATMDMQVKRGAGFVITRTARRAWDRFGLPITADEVVDALFELPDSAVVESKAGEIERPKWKTAHGRVFGRLIMIGGRKDARTGEWIAVQHIASVGAHEEGRHGN